MSNNYAKDSHLRLETSVKNDKTFLRDSYFTAPFKIIKPFYDEDNNMMKLCIMNASPGILEGDRYLMDLNVREGSRLHLYSQSYSKVFNMKDGSAYQNIKLSIERNSRLEYFLMPTIPYNGSNFFSEAEIHMGKDSQLLFREILSCGRYMSGERFGFNKYYSKTKIFYDGRMIFFDNTFLEPKAQNLDEIGFYEGYTHQANVYIINDKVNEEFRNSIVEYLNQEEEIVAGASRNCENMITIRILANSSEKLVKVTEHIRELDLEKS